MKTPWRAGPGAVAGNDTAVKGVFEARIYKTSSDLGVVLLPYSGFITFTPVTYHGSKVRDHKPFATTKLQT